MKHLSAYLFLLTALSFFLWLGESSQDFISSDQYGWHDDTLDDSEYEMELKKLCSNSHSFLVKCVLLFNTPIESETLHQNWPSGQQEASRLGCLQAKEFLKKNQNWTLYG